MNDETVFDELLQLSSSERAERVDQICSDPEQKRRVMELISAHDAPDSFLNGKDTTAYLTPDALDADSLIGDYKLLQQLGEGGMGTVYLAEQLRPVKRRVAFKIIKAGMDSRQFIARFEAERQALAMMDHAHIAKVLDGGTTEQGRPYFVMELVKGVAITEYCDKKKLSPRERLQLFIGVCKAIQHAHQKGVIHRDLETVECDGDYA